MASKLDVLRMRLRLRRPLLVGQRTISSPSSNSRLRLMESRRHAERIRRIGREAQGVHPTRNLGHAPETNRTVTTWLAHPLRIARAASTTSAGRRRRHVHRPASDTWRIRDGPEWSAETARRQRTRGLEGVASSGAPAVAAAADTGPGATPRGRNSLDAKGAARRDEEAAVGQLRRRLDGPGVEARAHRRWRRRRRRRRRARRVGHGS